MTACIHPAIAAPISARASVPALPGLDRVWAETRGDERICVAILDGPVDLSHPCFAGANVAQLDMLGVASAAGRASEHGTHIASVIFGQPGSLVHGLAPACRGIVIPVFAQSPEGALAPCSQLDLAHAITLAVQQGAQVINISGGQLEATGEAHPILARAVQLCADNKVMIVAAAGNEGCACLHVPAALPFVLAVGAMTSAGSPTEFSNWGEAYQAQGLLAPGENIFGATPGNGTAYHSGTSFATPVMSGVVALLLSLQLKRDLALDADAVRRALLASAVGCEQQPVANCQRLLAGRLNLVGALTQQAHGGDQQFP